MKISDMILCNTAKQLDMGGSNLFGVTRNLILPNIPGTVSITFYLTFELVAGDEPFDLTIEVVSDTQELVGRFEHDIGLPPNLDPEFNIITIAQPVTVRVANAGTYFAHISVNKSRVMSKWITMATLNTGKQHKFVH